MSWILSSKLHSPCAVRGLQHKKYAAAVAVAAISVEEQLSSTAGAQLHEVNNSDEKEAPFVNHAALLWAQKRKEWLTSPTRSRPRIASRQRISWSCGYDGVLSNTKPFPHPVPLSEVVDSVVDIWEEEGLFDAVL